MRKTQPSPATPPKPRGQRIGYARVSTTGQSLAEQRDKLRDAGCTKIFEEKISGAKRDRAELERLLEYVREHDTLVITKLDRIARNSMHLHAIAEDLERKHVDFIVIDQPQIDTTSSLGRLLFSVLGAVASFERDLINDRTAAGKARARAKGVKFGRKPELKADRLADLRARFAAGVSRGILAKEFGLARSSIYRLCQHITQPPVAAPVEASQHNGIGTKPKTKSRK
jgi:DNA invertase Pin-like site-specific DNA recombinase